MSIAPLKPFPSPKFIKKCSNCVYLGTYPRDHLSHAGFSLEQEYDVYYCENVNRNHNFRFGSVYVTRGGNNYLHCEGCVGEGRLKMDHEDWLSEEYYDIYNFLSFSPELEGYLYQKKIKLHPSFIRLSWDSHKTIKILAICALKTKKMPYELMLLIIQHFAKIMRIPNVLY